MNRHILLALALLAYATGAVAQGKGPGRQRSGPQNANCGGELVVVRSDGQRQQYTPTGKFFEQFAAIQIDQGEQARPAVPLATVLAAYSADWVEALDCDNRSLQLPSGLPFEGRNLFVLTGKGGLKAVQEKHPGDYANQLRQIRKLTFHVVSSQRPASPEPGPDSRRH